MASCFKLLAHCIRLADSRTFCTAGNSNPIKMAMMAMTTNNSISVNAGRHRFRAATDERERVNRLMAGSP
jgi:hypothetical protein